MKQNPRPHIASVFLASALLVACGETTVETVADEEPQRPNIIFIMSDDHAYQAISAYGSQLIETPNIDRIAAEGLRFDQAFVGNSICSPSRATLLTGKFSHANGLRNNIHVFDGSQPTLQRLMREAGYETAIIGKWHLKSEPTDFDYWDVLPDQGEYYNPDFVSRNGTRRVQGYVTDITTDLAIDWLEQRSDEQKPFLLFYHHKAPHREWWPPLDGADEFHGETLPEPDSLFDDYTGRGRAAREAEMRISDHMGLTNDNKITPENAAALGREPFMDWYDDAYRRQFDTYMNDAQRDALNAVYGPINDDFVARDPRGEDLTRWKYQRYLQDYLATIRSVDDNVGRLMSWLEVDGQLDNTVIIYTSDQGFYLGEHGWFDKRFMYEESFRTPLLIRWPGVVEAGAARSAIVQNIDFAPTILDIAGADVPADMHGKSMAPLFEADDADFRDAAYYHYYEYPGIHAVKRHYGVRTQRYKLMHYYHDIDEWELYDLQTDPAEMRNVYADLSYADVRETMTALLAEVQARYGDSPALAREFLEADLAELASE
ncbi:MAG: sulfatase [Woeseiaceae bacterium]|nr:sulfatase [Woeseiaceae bacterium]